MRIVTTAVGVVLVFVVGACAGSEPAATPPPSSPTTLPTAATPRPISVSLWHCGIDPVVVNGQKWEVSQPPFDATNAPKGWVGKGWAVVESPQSLAYRDESGVIVHFTPDDGVLPPACA